MVYRQSDNRVVPVKVGNATGGKAVALGHIRWETASALRCRIKRITQPVKNAVCTQKHTGHQPSEEPGAGKLHARI